MSFNKLSINMTMSYEVICLSLHPTTHDDSILLQSTQPKFREAIQCIRLTFLSANTVNHNNGKEQENNILNF